MSLILEALKKSEAQRRLGEAPNLGTPFSATRRRRSPLPWITLAVVVVAAGAGWWLLRPHAPATGATTPATAPAKDARAAADAKARVQPAAAASVPAQRPADSRAPPITMIAPPTPPPAATPHSAPPVTGAPTPVPPTSTLPAPAQAVVSAPAPPRPTPAAPKTVDQKEPAKSEPARAQPPLAATPAPASSPGAASTPAVPAPASSPASAEPAIPTVDDLAFDLRRDLPDLPITMQVYSADPARRFILVDGERKKEGDAIRDVAVREIRSNGVVLEFRGQRFLLPRPGS